MQMIQSPQATLYSPSVLLKPMQYIQREREKKRNPKRNQKQRVSQLLFNIIDTNTNGTLPLRWQCYQKSVMCDIDKCKYEIDKRETMSFTLKSCHCISSQQWQHYADDSTIRICFFEGFLLLIITTWSSFPFRSSCIRASFIASKAVASKAVAFESEK